MEHRAANNPDVTLQHAPNRRYWRDVYALAYQKKQPTVADLLDAMCSLGNEHYVEAFGGRLEKPFTPNVTRHEISYIAGKIPHTQQMELLEVAMEYGLILGVRASTRTNRELFIEAQRYRMTLQMFEKISERDGVKKQEPVSARTGAVHIALGMYLREKIDAFLAQQSAYRKTQGTEPDYAQQQQWNTEWSATDATPQVQSDYPLSYDQPDYFNRIKTAPANLLDISETEWRAITGVALGMCQPEDTPYPKRLTAIKEALVKTGTYYDKPAFAAKLKQDRASAAEQGQGARAVLSRF